MRPVIRVALAEDDAMVRAALRRYLGTEPGLQWAGEAVDAVEALQLVRSTPVDVLLLDLSMPGLCGLEALEKIHQAAPSVRIVVLSSYPASRFRADALRAGASAYVQKGCDSEQIVHAIEAAAAAQEES
jgi:DNA-binding NarL/FixJ family response regulator